ncbi:MAG: hydrolase 1, exosortase A system-associated [Novosphingobium sp.]
MSRRFVTFECEGNTLAATLDTGAATTGLVIVSGGNEVRAGPWNSQAQLAERIAAAGFPVLRFDRRGVGDSAGPNGGFRASAPDIAAALAAFTAEVPNLKRVVAFGNCDAASALMLGGGTGFDGLVLANPWSFDEADEEPGAATPMPPAALRAHYLRRLTDPRALWRLLTGKVKLCDLAASLAEAGRPATQSALAAEMARTLGGFTGAAVLLVAGRDRTGQAFLANWGKADPRIRVCPEATHSFVEAPARIWLQGQILAMLRGG